MVGVIADHRRPSLSAVCGVQQARSVHAAGGAHVPCDVALVFVEEVGVYEAVVGDVEVFGGPRRAAVP